MSINRGMDNEDVVHIYTWIFLIHKKSNSVIGTTQMDLEIVILSEVSQTEKDKYHMLSLLCGNLKKVQMNLFIK